MVLLLLVVVVVVVVVVKCSLHLETFFSAAIIIRRPRHTCIDCAVHVWDVSLGAWVNNHR